MTLPTVCKDADWNWGVASHNNHLWFANQSLKKNNSNPLQFWPVTRTSLSFLPPKQPEERDARGERGVRPAARHHGDGLCLLWEAGAAGPPQQAEQEAGGGGVRAAGRQDQQRPEEAGSQAAHWCEI